MESELLRSIASFCHRLKQSQIKYQIGGSVASGIWGEPRQTNDVDVEVWISTGNSQRFIEALEGYFLSANEVATALASRDYPCVQVVEPNSALRFDCFVQRDDDPFATESLGLSRAIHISASTSIQVAAPETILIWKMRWFELGNRTSDRQLNDLRALVRTSNLEGKFVSRWAAHFELQDLWNELSNDV